MGLYSFHCLSRRPPAHSESRCTATGRTVPKRRRFYQMTCHHSQRPGPTSRPFPVLFMMVLPSHTAFGRCLWPRAAGIPLPSEAGPDQPHNPRARYRYRTPNWKCALKTVPASSKPAPRSLIPGVPNTWLEWSREWELITHDDQLARGADSVLRDYLLAHPGLCPGNGCKRPLCARI